MIMRQRLLWISHGRLWRGLLALPVAGMVLTACAAPVPAGSSASPSGALESSLPAPVSTASAMADHLIVIGRGRLLADTPIADFVARSSHTSIVVRSPEAARLAELLVARGATVTPEGDGRLSLTGPTQEQ
jgi:hypothetical protein